MTAGPVDCRRTDTGQVATPQEDWTDRVRAAAVSGDEAALRQLFSEGRGIWGSSLSTVWAKVLSGLDASAITG